MLLGPGVTNRRVTTRRLQLIYEAQLANLSDDDDDDATVIRESPRHKVFARDESETQVREVPEIVKELLRKARAEEAELPQVFVEAMPAQRPEVPRHWNRHFWATPESQPLCIAWKANERTAATQRIVLPRPASSTDSWRSSPSSWKARLGAAFMLCFFVCALAAITLMTQSATFHRLETQRAQVASSDSP
jgi:hypothetical protein